LTAKTNEASIIIIINSAIIIGRKKLSGLEIKVHINEINIKQKTENTLITIMDFINLGNFISCFLRQNINIPKSNLTIEVNINCKAIINIILNPKCPLCKFN
jgi:hypothetical protein